MSESKDTSLPPKPTPEQVAVAMQWADPSDKPITTAQQRLITESYPGLLLDSVVLRILRAHVLHLEVEAKQKKPVRLELRSRADDYHCQLAGKSAVWDCGKTPEEAIGRWINTHGDDVGVNVIRVHGNQ